MEQFYADRDRDLQAYLTRNAELLEKGLLSPADIFTHAYTLGALQNATKGEND
jgi:hypothetical protein